MIRRPTRLVRPRDWPLRAKLAALLVVVSIAPLALVALLNVEEARSRLFEHQTALLAARSDQVMSELDRFNESYERAAARLARSPEVAALLGSGDAASVSGASLRTMLLGHQNGDPAVRGVALIDRSGRVRAGTEPGIVGKDRSFRRYVQDGLRGAALIADPYVAENGVPTIAYVSPVRAGGAVVGLAVFWVRAEALWAVAREFNGLAGEGSYAVIFDADGIRIAQTFSQEILFRPAGPLPPDVTRRLLAERRFGEGTHALLADVRAFPEQFARARADVFNPGLFEGVSPATGRRAYGVGRRFHSTRWTVFYMVPETTLSEPIASLTRQRLLLAVIVGLVSALIGILVAPILIRPIRALVGATERLSAGDLTTRVDASRRDELGLLGHAFNAMAGQLEGKNAALQRSHDELERQVASRTAELVDSERKYRDLYEHSPDMYLTASALTEEILDCNQTLCQRLGYEKSELIGRPFQTVYPDNERSEAARRLELFSRAEGFQDVERTLRCKDGALLEVSLNLRPVRDARGETIGIKATWRDIGKRKQADRDRQLLLQLGETLRSQTDRAGVLSAVAIQLGRYLGATRCVFAGIDQARDLAMSQGGYAIDGSWPAGATPLSSLDAVGVRECAEGRPFAVGDRATDPRTVESHAAGEVGADRSLLWVPRMREGRWVACLLVSCAGPRPWEEREVALAQLVAERVWQWIDHLDVLADLRLRDVADAVQRTEARFHALVDSVRDYAIVMLDPDGKVVTWSAGAELVSGHPAEEILGKEFTVFHTPEQLAEEKPRLALDAARATGRFEEEGWRVRRDGARFWANVVLTAIHEPGGGLVGFAKITRDFTERRKQEQVLTQSLKEREVLLQEVHHRVKNNLQVISSLISMQVRKLDHGSTRDALEECQTRVLAIALIHEKLYRSKDYSQVRFADYARSLANNVLHATGISPHNVALDLAIEDVPIGVDRAIPCGLVLNELITNSLKHGLTDGAGAIGVELKQVDGGNLSLTVRDHGAGLPAGFDIQKVRSMGLQLVCTLTDQLDGNLVVSSDQGAKFQLVFPGGD